MWVPIVLLIVLLIISAIIFIGGLFCIRATQSGEETFKCLFCCKNHQNEDKIDEKEQVDSKPATTTTTNQQPKTKTSTSTTSPKKTKYFNFRIRAMTPNATMTNQSQHQPVMTAKPKPEWLGPKQSRRNGGRRVSIPFGRHAQARERKMGQRGKKSQAWVKSPERVLKKVSTKAMAAKDIAMALKEAFIAFEAYESYEVEENGERS